jgi:HK97 family phage prohead protease
MKKKYFDPDAATLEVKASGDSEDSSGTLEGYASVFGNVDSYGEVVVKGAFKKTIKERIPKRMVKLMDSHQIFGGSKAVIGVVEEAFEDEKGLKFKARFSSVDTAQEVRTKIKEKILNALSFGFDVLKDEYHKEKKVRYLKEIRLWEISVVAWGANPRAKPTGVKGVIPISSSLDLSTAEDFEPGIARKAFRDFIGDDDPEDWTPEQWSTFAKFHLWVDPENSESLTGYKFPLCVVEDGEIKYNLSALKGAVEKVRTKGAWESEQEELEGAAEELFSKFGEPFPSKGESPITEPGAELVAALTQQITDTKAALQIRELRRSISG